MKTSRPFLSTAFLTILGRSGGFVIPFLIAAFYGATPATDAFFFAQGIVVLIITLFTHIFESALIPFLAERAEDPKAYSSLTNRTFVGVLGVLILLSVAGSFGLEPLLSGIGRMNSESAMLMQRAFFEMTPFLIFAVASSACHSIFFQQKIFWLPAISPLLRSVTVILSILLFRSVLHIHAVTVGFALGEILRWGITFFLLRRKTSWQPVLEQAPMTAKGQAMIGEMVFQGMALLAGNALFLSDQWFASQLGAGSLSYLNYADRLLQIPYILLVSAFLQIFLTDWSDTYFAEPLYHFWPKIRRDMKSVFIVCSLLGAFFWVARTFLVHIIYGRRSMAVPELQLIADLFGWLSLGFIPGVVRLLCARVLFVMKKSWFYCLQTWIELLANILLNSLMIRTFGIVGIAMATAVVYTTSTFFSYLYVRRLTGKGLAV